MEGSKNTTDGVVNEHHPEAASGSIADSLTMCQLFNKHVLSVLIHVCIFDALIVLDMLGGMVAEGGSVRVVLW